MFGEALSKGIVFLLMGFFTNTLGKVEFGRLSLIWVSIPLLSVFIDFSQRSYVKSVFINEPTIVKTVIAQIKKFCVFSTLFWFLIFWFKSLFGFELISSKIDIFLLVAAFFYAIIELDLSHYQINGSFKKYNFFFLLRNVTPYIGVAAIYFLTSNRKAVSFLYIQIVIGIVVAAYLYFGKRIKAKGKNFKETLSRSLRFSFPLIPAMFSVLALSFADRFIINYYYSEAEVAEYTVAYTVSSIFIAFFMATNKMWQKIILEKLKEGKLKSLIEMARKYVLVVVLFGLLIGFFSKKILLLMSNDSYLIVVEIIPILLIGMFFYFLYTILSNVPFFFGNTILQATPAFIAAIVNIILNFALLPKYGYKFAASTTAFSYFIEFLVIYLICLRKYNIDILFNVRQEK